MAFMPMPPWETSHPSRVRGLKHAACGISRVRQEVAPFTGAWIETTLPRKLHRNPKRRTLHGCVD